jgi:shikimate dehydrogenase
VTDDDDRERTTPVKVNGETRVTGLIGDPIAHTRSPAILNAGFVACGLNWIYVPFPAPAGHGGDAVRAARALGLAGLTVTMPHKADAAHACDELTPAAAALGAVNVVTVGEGGRLLGASTDGEGLVRSVQEEGFEPAGRDALVLGAGGAARAIVLALANAGARVTVAARRLAAAEAAAGLAFAAQRPRGGPGSGSTGEPGAAVTLDDVEPGAYALVVNATPLGMQGEPGPVAVDRLNLGQFVVDTVYHPMETPFLTAARARGIKCTNGLGMLVHQAALAFELWTGVDAPLEVMRAAAARDPLS